MKNFLKQLLLPFLLFYSLHIYADELIVEPDMGRTPIINAIHEAKQSVSLVMYGFTDDELLNALLSKKAKNVTLKIILEDNPYKSEDQNDETISKLNRYGVNWQGRKTISLLRDQPLHLIHQKTLILDEKKAIVMTFNFTRSTFKRNERNFALVIDDPKMVNDIQTIFSSDWYHKKSNKQFSNLILSPEGSRAKLVSIISNAKYSLQIYAQDISDYSIVGALARASRRGVSVEILSSRIRDKQANYLQRAGVAIRMCKKIVIHAKVFIVDQCYAVIGSVNLTKASLDNNRELSVITKNEKIVKELSAIFKRDWNMHCSIPHRRERIFPYKHRSPVDYILHFFKHRKRTFD